MLRALNEIDARYIEEAECKENFGNKKRKWTKILSAAACAVLVCGLTAIPIVKTIRQHNDIGTQPGDKITMLHWNALEGKFEYVPIDEIENSDYYYNLDTEVGNKIFENFSHTDPAIKPAQAVGYRPAKLCVNLEDYFWNQGYVDEDYLDEYIRDVEVSFGTDQDGNDVIRTMKAYTIKGIDSVYVIAIKSDGEMPYGIQDGVALTFYNTSMEEESGFISISDMIDTLNLDEQLFIGALFSTGTLTETGIVTETNIKEEDRALLEMLLSLTGDAARHVDIAEDSESVGIQCGLRILGGSGFGIQIFEEGYLMTNLCGVLSVFQIDADAAREIIDCAKENPAEWGCYQIYENGVSGVGLTKTEEYTIETSGGYIPNGALEEANPPMTESTKTTHSTEVSEPSLFGQTEKTTADIAQTETVSQTYPITAENTST